MTKLEEYWLLLAHIVRFVGVNVTLATPEISPVLLLKNSPDGIGGEVSHARTSPPRTIGAISNDVMFVVRLTSETA